MLNCRYDAKTVDVETAFLYGNLEKDIKMESSLGINKKGDKILVMKKSICELIVV